jgi:hypothetical protein
MILVLLVLAFVLFLLAAIGVPSSRINLVAAGLAAYVASQLVGILGAR